MKMLVTVLFLLLLSNSACSAEHNISIERKNADTPLSRSEIIAEIERQYEKSRILSIQSRPSNAAPDCHIVKVLKFDGELLQIYVAC